MNKGKNIAILGGTFDPIHVGHLIAGQAVMDTGRFDALWLMPTGKPPHKATDPADKEHRLAMCRLAVTPFENVTVSSLELDRQGRTYTVDTFRELKALWPEDTFWLIIGTDSLMALEQWHMPQQLLNEVNFVVVDRGGHDLQRVRAQMDALSSTHKGDFLHVTMPLVDLSSTDIRKRVADGKSIRYRVPDSVLVYIEAEGLYKPPIYEAYLKGKDWEDKLRAALPGHRFDHTLRVTQTAYELANHHHESPKKAVVAAYLHDCVKNYKAKKLMALAQDYGLTLTAAEMANKDLLHAKVGAAVARDDYGVTDSEVLDAIAYHTTGRPAMSPIEQIVYISDYTEPGRKDRGRLAAIRDIALEDLDKAMLWILEDSLSYLKTKDKPIDPMTKEAYRYYDQLRKDKQ